LGVPPLVTVSSPRIYPATPAGISAALAALGDSAEQVANSLRRGRHVGTPGVLEACPVARYLRTVITGVTGVLASDGGMEVFTASDVVYASTPHPVATFITGFDIGGYPDLRRCRTHPGPITLRSTQPMSTDSVRDPDPAPRNPDADTVVNLDAARARRTPGHHPDTSADTPRGARPDTETGHPDTAGLGRADINPDATGPRRPDAGADANPDTHYEVVLDDEPSPGGMAVAVAAERDTSAWLPILPSNLQNWATLKSTARRIARRARHKTLAHTVRSPWYLAQCLFWSVIGVFRLVERQLSWWWVAEQTTLRQHAADADDYQGWLKLHREVKATRLWRGIVIAAEVLALAVAVPLLWPPAPWWAKLAALCALLLWLAQIGKPPGKAIVPTAVVSARFRKLNPDIVLRAYYAAGLGKADKDDQQVRFGSRMQEDRHGAGSWVLVDLPHGRTFDDATAARGKIASGLDVALSQVYITRDPTSHRRHVLWVAHQDPLAAPAGRTPLLRNAAKAIPTDIWVPAPFGLDERGNKVAVPILWHSIEIGAQPRQGKTFAGRSLGLYAAMDPHCRVIVLDAGGKPDWRKFALIAHRYAFGLAMTRDGDPVDIVLDTLRELRAEVQDRYERLSRLPVDICPEGKLTRQIARDPKYNMPVITVFLDEFQEYFDLGEASKEIAGHLVYLVKVAPAAGISLIDMTQRPSGVGTGQVAQQFISFRDNHQVRFALRTGSWQMSDLVLGAGAYSEGHDSSTLLPTYKGVGILRGASDETPTVRTYLADHEDAEKILLAARGLRERAGTLSGMAIGQVVAKEARDVLADVRSVFAAGEPGLHWEHIATRLAEQLPEHYADISPDAISAQIRDLGVPSVVVKVAGVGLRGARLDAIDTAIRARRTG
jgi:S-DNA-T family DNA segregation ATPase FtsK/SpoIIIE